MHDGTLNHALETQRRLRIDLCVPGTVGVLSVMKLQCFA
jgi:hypothetical protein